MEVDCRLEIVSAMLNSSGLQKPYIQYLLNNSRFFYEKLSLSTEEEFASLDFHTKYHYRGTREKQTHL